MKNPGWMDRMDVDGPQAARHHIIIIIVHRHYRSCGLWFVVRGCWKKLNWVEGNGMEKELGIGVEKKAGISCCLFCRILVVRIN